MVLKVQEEITGIRSLGLSYSSALRACGITASSLTNSSHLLNLLEGCRNKEGR